MVGEWHFRTPRLSAVFGRRAPLSSNIETFPHMRWHRKVGNHVLSCGGPARHTGISKDVYDPSLSAGPCHSSALCCCSGSRGGGHRKIMGNSKYPKSLLLCARNQCAMLVRNRSGATSLRILGMQRTSTLVPSRARRRSRNTWGPVVFIIWLHRRLQLQAHWGPWGGPKRAPRRVVRATRLPEKFPGNQEAMRRSSLSPFRGVMRLAARPLAAGRVLGVSGGSSGGYLEDADSGALMAGRKLGQPEFSSSMGAPGSDSDYIPLLFGSECRHGAGKAEPRPNPCPKRPCPAQNSSRSNFGIVSTRAAVASPTTFGPVSAAFPASTSIWG